MDTRARGFTLIELLMAVAAMALLAAIVAPTYQGFVERSRSGQALSDLLQLDMAIENFAARNFALPDSLDELANVPRTDPWGNAYQYLRIEGNSTPGLMGQVRKDQALNPINSDFDLYSAGEDGQSRPALTARPSRDDLVRGGNGGFLGSAMDF